jgi:hypothetical protein
MPEQLKPMELHNMKITTTEVDSFTGIETVIERDETAAETKERVALEKKIALIEAENQSKAIQRQAIADRLGLTADELQVLLG